MNCSCNIGFSFIRISSCPKDHHLVAAAHYLHRSCFGTSVYPAGIAASVYFPYIHGIQLNSDTALNVCLGVSFFLCVCHAAAAEGVGPPFCLGIGCACGRRSTIGTVCGGIPAAIDIAMIAGRIGDDLCRCSAAHIGAGVSFGRIGPAASIDGRRIHVSFNQHRRIAGHIGRTAAVRVTASVDITHFYIVHDYACVPVHRNIFTAAIDCQSCHRIGQQFSSSRLVIDIRFIIAILFD